MNPALISYLQSRRSVAANLLGEPGPDPETVRSILKVASRVPDHGKLAPWRFIVISGEARQRLSTQFGAIAVRNDPDMPRERLEQEQTRLSRAPVVIAVVSRAAQHPKIPEWEQILSAGAVCTCLYMAANAHGFAANWLTEWMAYDREALALLEIGEDERLAGFVHIGRSDLVPADRPRPDIEDITTWLD
ncbi:MAG: nitroreductase [Alphaproteobacteria bacterium]|nr:nitroreductase [Alphaproteobacteria bacterium]